MIDSLSNNVMNENVRICILIRLTIWTKILMDGFKVICGDHSGIS